MKDNFSNNHKVIETVLTLILVFVVLAVCVMIISPFLMSILWAVIIAIAVFPVYEWLVKKMKGRRILPAVLVTILMFAFIFIPIILFVESAASSIHAISTYLHSGKVNVTTPSLKIKEVPVVGEPVYDFLLSISENLEAAFKKYYPQILNASKVLLGGVLSAAVTFLQLLLSVIIAGVLLATRGTGPAADDCLQPGCRKPGYGVQGTLYIHHPECDQGRFRCCGNTGPACRHRFILSRNSLCRHADYNMPDSGYPADRTGYCSSWIDHFSFLYTQYGLCNCLDNLFCRRNLCR